MGTKPPNPAGRKRRKKGRPSLLDLHRRSLRLEKLHNQHRDQNPSPDPSPKPSSPLGRRAARLDPSPGAQDGGDDEDEDEDGSEGRRREKKLRLLLEDEEGGRRNSAKATGSREEELPDAGPATALPDKKLLVFILDRLQKKDTYGVFSEPVDPSELPDYYNIIEHPMDFGTVRKKLSAGAYKNLEQFEKDVFLISLNAMCYNAPDTIYYRQAKSIQELAKKNFENLRQESDDNEPEPKVVARRGRPPSKGIVKRTAGRPPTEHASSDFSSNTTVANTGDGVNGSNLNNDLSRKGMPDISARAPYGVCCTESSSWMAEDKSERNEEHSGAGYKGNMTKNGKKPSVTDENRRNTYKKPQPSTCLWEQSVFTMFDMERKLLVPIALHMEYAYARSLARFAAKLGPICWEVAAKRIERALPPGTKFSLGWVRDSEGMQQFLAPTSCPDPLSHTETLSCTTVARALSCSTLARDVKLQQIVEPASNDLAVENGHFSSSIPQASSSGVPIRSSDPREGTDPARCSSYEDGISPQINGGVSDVPFSSPFQLHQNFGMRSSAHVLNPTIEFNASSHAGMTARSSMPLSPVGADAPMIDMVSRNRNSVIHRTTMRHVDAEVEKLADSSSIKNSNGSLMDPVHDFQGPWQGLSVLQKSDSIPPDLNVRFQSPGSAPASKVIVQSQQPDLALQL